MDMGSIVKWGLLIIAGWIALRWLSNKMMPTQTDIPGGEIWGSGWAAPLVGPSPVTGWAPPWAYRSRGGRRRR
jgi:hypothetical protein